MDDLSKALIEIYTAAQQSIIDIIIEKEAKGNVTTYQKSLFIQIQEILVKLDKSAWQWSNDTVETLYWQSVKDVNDYFDITSFSKLNTAAIEILAKNIYIKLNNANVYVGRRVEDEIRDAGVKAITQKLTTGETVRQCKQNLVNSLIDKGIKGITDKNGREISLDAYASTIARSTSAEVTNTATVQRMSDLDKDLVKMSEHATTCAICSTYQGRVYSVSGKDTRFPALNTVPGFSSGFNNIHCNCKHRVFAYSEDLAADFEGDLKSSNRSFDMSDKDKKNIEAYQKQQALQRQFIQDKNQWQRYRLAMPQDTPKSFASFRRMKSSNSEKFQELQSSYRSLRQGGEG